MGKTLNNDQGAVFALGSLYDSFGYRHYKMSRFEEYDLYVRNKDFLLSDQVITFMDASGRLLALKPDVTLSIIKNTKDAPGAVQKLYYHENVYRVAKGTRSFQEIMQAGLECIGELSAYEVGEVTLLAAKSLAMICDSFVLDISHMGLVSAVLESSGLSVEGKRRAMNCLRQKNAHEIMTLCAEENARWEKLVCMVNGSMEALAKLLTTDTEKKAWQELDDLVKLLKANGFDRQVQVDFSAGNDLKYYSGVVFNGYISGIPTSVLSGGQYDKLLRKMGRQGSAIGFAVYADLLEGMKKPEKSFDLDALLLHGGEDTERLLTLAEKLRRQGSVLVARERPCQRTWRRLYEVRNGEAVLLEDNG